MHDELHWRYDVPLHAWRPRRPSHPSTVSEVASWLHLHFALLSQERVKLWTANLAHTFTGPSEQKPIKNLGEKGAWAYPGTAKFFEYLLLSQELVSYELQILYAHS